MDGGKLYTRDDVERIARECVENVDPRAWEASGAQEVLDQHLMVLGVKSGEIQNNGSPKQIESLVEDGPFGGMEDIMAVLNRERRFREASGRPPSKVEKWVSRIEQDQATLSDAEADVSRATYYKIRNEVGGDRPYNGSRGQQDG